MSNQRTTETMSHTPGPWALERFSGSYVIQDARTGSDARYVDIAKIAFVRTGGKRGCRVSYCELPEDAANARLIAAAPELLDVARNVAGFDNSLLLSANLNLLRSTLREYRDQARAAIAKAEGRT